MTGIEHEHINWNRRRRRVREGRRGDALNKG